jgi:hypothetical protein
LQELGRDELGVIGSNIAQEIGEAGARKWGRRGMVTVTAGSSIVHTGYAARRSGPAAMARRPTWIREDVLKRDLELLGVAKPGSGPLRWS